MSATIDFNASVYVSEQMNRQLVNMAQDLAHRCVTECANHYGFDADEAIRLLGLAMIRLERKAPAKAKTAKKDKVSVPKPAFPLPYNGEFNDACCYALRQNNGLYTQCIGVRKGDNQFCKSCSSTLQKTGAEMPEYGTIQQRQAVGIFEYVDPKGRKPIAYTKVMKKYKIDQEQVLDEAGKFNIVINPEHFVVPENESKRGRPSKGGEKEPKVKGAKGRPKKSKKVLQIEGDEEDLFAALVAEANDEGSPALETPSAEEIVKKKKGKTEEEKEQERLAKEAEKEAKRLAAEQAKAEKEAKLAAEKAAKEAEKEAKRLAAEAKKKAEEEEKAAKKAAAELAKKEKEEKLAAEKAAKEAAKANKNKKPAAAAPKGSPDGLEPAEEEEPDVVKKIEFEGKKYLKSKKTGIVYDYNEYVKNGEQVVVGKWNETSNKIEFTPKDDEEEEEEEYDL